MTGILRVFIAVFCVRDLVGRGKKGWVKGGVIRDVRWLLRIIVFAVFVLGCGVTFITMIACQKVS